MTPYDTMRQLQRAQKHVDTLGQNRTSSRRRNLLGRFPRFCRSPTPADIVRNDDASRLLLLRVLLAQQALAVAREGLDQRADHARV